VTAPGLTVPRKLHRGDTLRVVAPARSRQFVAEHDYSGVIDFRFAGLGLRLTFADHVDERDDFQSSSVASRVSDLHAAFADPQVAGVLTVIGGFNSNELLPHLDWDLIAANPKILCGYSDITALQNAILARASLVTYSGPHWSSFGMRDHFEQTQRWFAQALFGRFQEASGVTRSLLEQIIARQDRLAGRPILGNVDFGHTNPLATFPIGGRAALTVGATSSLRISDS